MDIASLTAFLAPFLPFLVKLGEKVTESIAEQFGADAWAKAKAIWAKLQPQVEAKPALQEAITDLATTPEDDDLQTVLRVQLKKLFDQDQELAAAIAQILHQHPNPIAEQTVFNISGSQMTNFVGQGTINYQEAPSQIRQTTFGSSPPSPQINTPEVGELTTTQTILILAANPVLSSPLRLDMEMKAIQAGLERSRWRDRYDLQQRWAVSPTEVRRALLDCQPNIVHFCGHGYGGNSPSVSAVSRDIRPAPTKPVGGLVLQTETGQPQFVSGAALTQLFSVFANQIQCVILNACYSEEQANAIAQQIPYVIGMNQAIGDQAAIEFAIGFYDGLLAGRAIEQAYQLGCNAIQLAGIPEHLTPVLKHK